MPRIRKKTSKRVSINKRERVKKKVKEARRKKSKEAKKNPQWKSKHAKDPGIPNNFPYKDQILAEVAEQRRLAAEEKQKRREEKKAAKAQTAEDGEDDDEVAFDGVRAIAAQRAVDGNDDEDVEMDAEVDEEEDEVPVLINPDLPNLKVVLDAADVVIEVLDARDPPSFRSAHLEEVAKELGKKVLLVLSKIDACPREAVEAWAATLRQEYPTVLFRSSSVCLPVSVADTWSKGKGKERADDAWGLDALTALLQQRAAEKKGDEPLTIAVTGMTNVGKTSFVNSLLGKAVLQTYTLASSTNDFSPTTTTHPQEVTVDLEGGKSLRVIDTPGLLWHHVEDLSDEDVTRIRACDILLRNRGHIERLKDPSVVMSELVSRASREDLMLLYNLPIFMEGDATAFLSSVARANGFIKKNGSPDLTGAARTVLRDWSSGKFARFTTPSNPPPSSNSSSDNSLADAYTKDESILSNLSTRKELRKAGGLVKLHIGEVDARKVMLEAGYFVSPSDDGVGADEEDDGALDDVDEVGLDGEESEGIDEEEGSEDEEDEDEEEGEDEDEDEEVDELESSPPRGKRKRAPTKAPAQSAKRVAFAPEPKGTKQARSAAGAKGAAASKLKAKADKPAAKAAKKPVKATSKASAAAPPKKVANAASSKKGGASAAKDGEVAYDFKQFF